jgi:hypothetical protein
VRTVETATDHGRVVLAILVVAALAALLALAVRRLGAAERAVAAVFVLVGAATGVTLATTAAWDHHAQMLAYPGALLAAVAALAAERVRAKVPRLALQAAVTAAAVLLLGGSKPGVAGGPVSTWFHGVRSGTAEALEQARSRLPAESEVSYAHLGQNDEEGHAAFLGGGWTLACARFHQYPWTPASALDGVLDCVRDRRPTLVLVTSSLSDREHAPASWHGFVVSARRLLARDYTRVYFVRHAHGTVGVWRLRART